MMTVVMTSQRSVCVISDRLAQAVFTHRVKLGGRRCVRMICDRVSRLNETLHEESRMIASEKEEGV